MFSMRAKDDKDQLKVERLYKKYSSLMFSEANKILQDKQLAEDAVQQSFVKIISNLHKIDENNCPQSKNFLVIICVNVAKSICKKKLYLNIQNDEVDDMDTDTADTGNDPLDILVNKESVEWITKSIKALPPKYRDALLLKRAHKYSREEIAKYLEIPEETVKKRLTRARKMLAQALDKEGMK